MAENILVIGAAGQIGSELVMELRRIYGTNMSLLPTSSNLQPI